MTKKITKIFTMVSNNQTIKIPLATIQGVKEGPVAVVTAGVHGCEYPAIIASIRLFQELQPEHVYGTIKIIPITNVAAFEARHMFVTPADGKNLNRVFPGNLKGSYSERLAYHYMEIVKGADYHIDLHGGDMVEDLDPFAIYHKGPTTEIEEKSYKIACAYGLPNIVSTSTNGLWKDIGTSYANVSEHLGIPSAILEVGALGILDEVSVQMHLRGLHNVLRTFGNLAGAPENFASQEEFVNMQWVYTKQQGIFHLQKKVGEYIKQMDPIGVVEDYFGNQLEIVHAPCDGKILFTTNNPAINTNGLIAGIGIN